MVFKREDKIARREAEAVVVGADTFIGSHLAKALADCGCAVTAYGMADSLVLSDGIACRKTDYLRYDIPESCRLIFFCHDVSQDCELHTKALSTLCEHLASTHAINKQVRLCYCSSANICNADGHRITENSEIYPHSLREEAIAHAELLLKAWCCMSRNAVAPHIFRHGELYGDADTITTTIGHVNECLSLARQGRDITFYGNLNQLRTLTHIDDFTSAVVAIALQDFIPSIINIPGERISVFEYLMAIAERYGVEWIPTAKRPDVIDENNPAPSCDRILSSVVFKSLLPDFKPKHRFKKWLNLQCLMSNE